jgi:hypothetical protein
MRGTYAKPRFALWPAHDGVGAMERNMLWFCHVRSAVFQSLNKGIGGYTMSGIAPIKTEGFQPNGSPNMH